MHKNNTREKALQILYRIETKQAYAALLLDQVARDKDWDGDQDFLRQLVKGTLEWRGRIDFVLEQIVKGGLASLTPWIRNILRLATYQILFLERVPPEAAVDESVELAKKYGHRGTVKLVNAVLRRVVAQGKAIVPPVVEQDPAEHIAILYSHPKWIVQRWINQIGVEETIKLCMANNRAGHLCLRTNTLKISTPDLQMQLIAEGVELHPARYASDCTIVTRLPGNARLHELSAYRDGLFQIQDESSALVAHLVDPQPGEFIIDLCSAPGGKTTHMAALMHNQGRILAADVHRNRLRLIHANCERLGITIVEEVCADGRTLQVDRLADCVLVDAPCSGFGVLGQRSDARWNKTESDLQRLQALQLELLQHASTLVKPGGRLIYSTCTIDTEENEGIVQAFMKISPDYKLLKAPERVPTSLLDQQGYYRTWPHRDEMGGAFGAVMLRNESLPEGAVGQWDNVFKSDDQDAELKEKIELQTIAIGALVNKATLERLNEKYDKLFDALITHDRLTNEQLVELRTQQMKLDGKLVGAQAEMRQGFEAVNARFEQQDSRIAGVQAEMQQGFEAVNARFEEQDKRLARSETTLNEHTTLLTQILARLPEKP